MNDLPTLEHALYGGQDAGGYRFLARSQGFRDEWLTMAERLCTGFGERPAGVACPRAIFVQPLDPQHVALVHVADQGRDDQGRPGTLAFHVIAIPLDLYRWLGGDPFHLADQIAPPWTARGTLSPLDCPAPAPPRLVAQVQKVLNVPHTATLLGGVQALLDGGRLVIERTAPDETLVRSFWALLPTSSRAEYWPASFAFSNALGFHVVVVPRIDPESFATYLREEHAGDYPESKYEYDLHIAAEQGDQDTLDALFARRSYREVRRIGLVLLVVAILLPIMIAFLKKPEGDKKPDNVGPSKGDTVEFKLPEASRFVPLNEEETAKLRESLLLFARKTEVVPPPKEGVPLLIFGSQTPLTAAALLILDRQQWLSFESLLLDRIDQKLGTPDRRRAGGSLRNLGPIERQLRGLSFKHAIEGYNDLKLKPPELIERLQEKLDAEKKP